MPDPSTVDWMVSGKVIDRNLTFEALGIHSGSAVLVVKKGSAQDKEEPAASRAISSVDEVNRPPQVEAEAHQLARSYTVQRKKDDLAKKK